jgi:hypothetical protein
MAAAIRRCVSVSQLAAGSEADLMAARKRSLLYPYEGNMALLSHGRL